MKKLLILLALASVLTAAPNPNRAPVKFVIVDYVPHPPAFTKASLWQYLRWLHLY